MPLRSLARLVLSSVAGGVIASSACGGTRNTTSTPAAVSPSASMSASTSASSPPPPMPMGAIAPSTPALVVAPAPPDPVALLREYLHARLPTGGTLHEENGVFTITHVNETALTPLQIAALYLELTDVYSAPELAEEIAKAQKKPRWASLAKGTEVAVPRALQSLPVDVAKNRLGWPSDGSMRGLYLTGEMAAAESFPKLLDKVAEHGMNAVVVDAKDVTGTLAYASDVALAVETGATKSAPIRSFSRVVRAAHAKGVRVVARVSCFRDEFLARRRDTLAIQRRGGGAHRNVHGMIDWLDPTNEDVRGYLVAIVDEVLAAGVDEVQLDYVRYPTEGVGDADFKLGERKLTTRQVIADFVGKVHDKTKAAGVPLSLDVFGIVAWGFDADVNSTGQDLTLLGPEIEALSPMVYPSHFADGFNGYEVPGAHADIVGIGTRKAIEMMKARSPKVVVRPWVQAFPYKSPGYGSGYIADQIASAAHVGGVGWLAWNSGGEYGATFGATSTKR
ncbi:MAG: putative glycoside hydrolase [Polyangiales bacterium]